MPLCLMWCSCSCSQQPLIGCRLLPLWCCLLTSANNRSLVPQCLSASCGALALLLLAANSRSLVVGCCLSGVASLACSHRLAFSSISIINNRSLVPQCLSASCGALALLLLAANSRSLAVGCCLSGVASLACSHRQSACSQQPFIGCRLLPLWCCFSCLQPLACFLFFFHH